MIQPHIGDRVKSTIYPEAGIVISVTRLSDRPDTLVKLDDGTSDWVYSQTEIEPA
jgi:hypothetical protein